MIEIDCGTEAWVHLGSVVNCPYVPALFSETGERYKIADYKPSYTWHIANEVRDWCAKNECAKPLNLKSPMTTEGTGPILQFTDHEAATMFLLRWRGALS